ncbi:hypothetical protein KFU94_14375 [Chloroflexi bacterium TSY]|nr:hypothetical protein [Chloroflexi bacterium TSY]
MYTNLATERSLLDHGPFPISVRRLPPHFNTFFIPCCVGSPHVYLLSFVLRLASSNLDRQRRNKPRLRASAAVRTVMLVLFLLMSSIAPGHAQDKIGTILTVAGPGSVHSHGDHGLATNATLTPRDVAVDSHGNLYIADNGSYRIRKVDATTGIITTVAGTGRRGHSGDHGPALNAQLDYFSDIEIDDSGNLFIVGGYRIRKVDAATDIINTIAGTGKAGYSGDGGLAIHAQLAGFSHIAVGNNGDLFIADDGNERIRKVDATTGIITTVAGTGVRGYSGDHGPATNAQFSYPTDVALDSSGNLFIADHHNSRVRRVDAVTGIITTIAGNGELGHGGDNGLATKALFNRPTSLAIDGRGDLYISDQFNNRICKVDMTTGIVTTIVGSGKKGHGGDNGPAIGATLHWPSNIAVDSSGNLWIADSPNKRVRKVDATTGLITTVAGAIGGDHGPAIDAHLDDPTDIAIDGGGNLYIADRIYIRRVDAATGVILTIAGNGEWGYDGDGVHPTSTSLSPPPGIAVDESGNLYMADLSARRIRKVGAITNIIITVAGTGKRGYSGDHAPAISATLVLPQDVAVDGSGNFYIADRGNHSIRRVDGFNGIITTIAGSGEQGMDGDGGPATDAQFGALRDITLDRSGNLFIVDGHRIRRVDATTNIITTVAGLAEEGYSGDGGPATSAQFARPSGVAVDSMGNLFIADAGNARIRRVEAATGIVTTVAGTGQSGYNGEHGLAIHIQLDDIADIAIDKDDNLYVADRGNRRIRKVDAATGLVTTVAGSGCCVHPGDRGPASSASLYMPSGVAVDQSGNLYIAEPKRHRIRKVDTTTGIITTMAGTSEVGDGGDDGLATGALLHEPTGVATDGGGNLFVADVGNHRIRKVDATTGLITTVAGSGTAGDGGDDGLVTEAQLRRPADVAVDDTGNLFIADTGNHRIRKVDAMTGLITTVAGSHVSGYNGDDRPATDARLRSPTGIAVDSRGNLFIADRDNHRIRKVDATTGLITTIAGTGVIGDSGDNGLAINAQLQFPSGVTMDRGDNLFIADTGNQRIRKVDTITGFITTVAGSGIQGYNSDGGLAASADLNNPTDLAVDSKGDLFIADRENHRIRQVLGVGIPAGRERVVVFLPLFSQ